VTLNVSPDDLNAVIKHLQDYIDRIDELQPHVQTVTKVDGFGGFKIGVQLAQKFTEKGSGSEGIAQRLIELQDAARSLQDSIRKAAVVYEDADQTHANAVTKVTQSVPGTSSRAVK
jgi:prefoldin subunit 5